MKWSRWHERTYEASTLASGASWSIDMFENLYFRCGWMESTLKIARGCSAAFNPRGGMLLYFRSSPKYSYLDFPIWHIWQVCRIAVHLRAKLSADVGDPKFFSSMNGEKFLKMPNTIVDNEVDTVTYEQICGAEETVSPSSFPPSPSSPCIEARTSTALHFSLIRAQNANGKTT